MPMLPGGDVVPAFLEVAAAGRGYDGGNFNNYRLRVGEVKEIVWPDDDRSRSKKFTEYRVYVQQRSNGTASGKMYENCTLLNPLAGLADRARWNLRADTKKDSLKAGVGSKVLLLCINGETNSAVIVGGVRDAQDAKDPGTSQKPLHDAEIVFNGVRFYVNDDGELEIKYAGKSKADGTTDASKDVVGQRILLDKDGGILLVDGAGDVGLYVDHKNHKVTVAHEKGFQVGEATDAFLMGTSYRNAEQQLHTQLMGQLQALQTAMSTMASQLTAAGTALSGGPAAAAATPMGAAGAAAVVMATTLGQMRQAIQSFEQSAAQKNSFLSHFNKLD